MKEVNKEGYLNNIIEEAKPLRLVGNKSQGYCITFGQYRISDIKTTPQEALDEIFTNEWTLIINLIGVITGLQIKTSNDTKK